MVICLGKIAWCIDLLIKTRMEKNCSSSQEAGFICQTHIWGNVLVQYNVFFSALRTLAQADFGADAPQSFLETMVLRNEALPAPLLQHWAMSVLCSLPVGGRLSWSSHTLCTWALCSGIAAPWSHRRLMLQLAFYIIQYLAYIWFSGNLLGLWNCIKMVIGFLKWCFQRGALFSSRTLKSVLVCAVFLESYKLWGLY